MFAFITLIYPSNGQTSKSDINLAISVVSKDQHEPTHESFNLTKEPIIRNFKIAFHHHTYSSTSFHLLYVQLLLR